MDSAQLAQRLCIIALLRSAPLPPLPGKTPKTNRAFPKQIEKLAQSIEEVNARGILYDQHVQAWVEAHNQRVQHDVQVRFGKMLEEFEKLPEILRYYAGYWRRVVQRRRISREQGQNTLKRETNFQRFAIGSLIHSVCQSAHSPFYDKVSILLLSAFEVAKLEPSISLDEDNLRNYYNTIFKPLLGLPGPQARPKN